MNVKLLLFQLLFGFLYKLSIANCNYHYFSPLINGSSVKFKLIKCKIFQRYDKVHQLYRNRHSRLKEVDIENYVTFLQHLTYIYI